MPGRGPSSPARAAQPPTVLEQAAELANQGRHAEAIAACERHLRHKGPGAPAYYLMGMICQAAGDRRRAEDCFHKTVYLDPQHDEALLALALWPSAAAIATRPPASAAAPRRPRPQPRPIPKEATCDDGETRPHPHTVSARGDGLPDRPASGSDCWHRIGVSGDRSCPELNAFIHCRNCPVFAAAARTFFDRPAPEGYLADWSRWLAESDGLGPRGESEGRGDDDDDDTARPA